jgi:peptide/nickel transport system permease protein
MELTWTGTLGPFLVPALGIAIALWAALLAVRGLLSFATPLPDPQGTTTGGGFADLAASAGRGIWWVAAALILAIPVIGALLPGTEAQGIVGATTRQFWPVWLALVLTFAVSIRFRRRLGLYGKVFESPVGMIGFGIVMFWVFTALFADLIITFDPLGQFSGMRTKVPGTPLAGAEDGQFGWFLLGGDHLARDVFSRMVMGAREVLKITPAATLFAFMVGVTLGVPAGYFGGRLDTGLSFLANLVLAFPVILLFYLLVTPEITETRINILDFILPGDASSACKVLEGWTPLAPLCMTIPEAMAAVLFLFPIIFLTILVNARFFTDPMKRNLLVAVILLLGLWVYLGLALNADPLGIWSMKPNMLNVFVSVVFVNSPTVFRIVRGIVMDLKARDYVAAGQTRGEGPWYIMLWEILPNARGPLIVDFCLRIGYTTILLGTLGFFGLGVAPESPDWGSTIDEGRKTLARFPHAAIVPALALMSLVLGLNLLADGLREESLKD